MVFNDTGWRSRQPPPRQGADGPVIDMTPEGEFVDMRPPPGAPPFGRLPLGTKVMGISILAAVLAGFAAITLLALWLALQLIPIAIGAGLIAYGVFRFQAWRAGRSLGGNGNWLRR